MARGGEVKAAGACQRLGEATALQRLHPLRCFKHSAVSGAVWLRGLGGMAAGPCAVHGNVLFVLADFVCVAFVVALPWREVFCAAALRVVRKQRGTNGGRFGVTCDR